MLPLHEFVIFLVYLKALDKQIPKFRVREGGQVFEKIKFNDDGKAPILTYIIYGIQYYDRNSSEECQDSIFTPLKMILN